MSGLSSAVGIGRASASQAGQRHSHRRAASCSSGRGPTRRDRVHRRRTRLPRRSTSRTRRRAAAASRGERRCPRGTSRSPSCSSGHSGRSRTSTAPPRPRPQGARRGQPSQGPDRPAADRRHHRRSTPRPPVETASLPCVPGLRGCRERRRRHQTRGAWRLDANR